MPDVEPVRVFRLSRLSAEASSVHRSGNWATARALNLSGFTPNWVAQGFSSSSFSWSSSGSEGRPRGWQASEPQEWRSEDLAAPSQDQERTPSHRRRGLSMHLVRCAGARVCSANTCMFTSFCSPPARAGISRVRGCAQAVGPCELG